MGYRLRQSVTRRAELETALQTFISALPGTDVRRAILFGSLARGDVGPASDVDLIIIRESTAPFVRRGEDLLALWPAGTPVDLFVYTPQEWQTLCDSNSFFRQVQKEGVVLYQT